MHNYSLWLLQWKFKCDVKDFTVYPSQHVNMNAEISKLNMIQSKVHEMPLFFHLLIESVVGFIFVLQTVDSNSKKKESKCIAPGCGFVVSLLIYRKRSVKSFILWKLLGIYRAQRNKWPNKNKNLTKTKLSNHASHTFEPLNCPYLHGAFFFLYSPQQTSLKPITLETTLMRKYGKRSNAATR